MSSFPLQRSKKLLESEGWRVWIVETWNGFIKQRRDLFNMADLVAIRPDIKGVTAIQCCGEDIREHIRKLLEGYETTSGKEYPPNPYLSVWIKSGNRFFIWGWRKRKDVGKRKSYQLKQVEFTVENGEVVHREL